MTIEFICRTKYFDKVSLRKSAASSSFSRWRLKNALIAAAVQLEQASILARPIPLA